MAKRKPKPKQKLRLEWIEAGTLDDNPHNWRRHPEGQTVALKNLIDDDDIGWAGALLYNERTKRLIDGHARKKIVDPKTMVPVLIGAWTEAAERKIQLTLDPLAQLAEVDTDQLKKLLDDTDLDADVFAALLAELERIDLPDEPAGEGDDGKGAGDKQFGVVIDCENETEQNAMIDHLTGMGIKCRGMVT